MGSEVPHEAGMAHHSDSCVPAIYGGQTDGWMGQDKPKTLSLSRGGKMANFQKSCFTKWMNEGDSNSEKESQPEERLAYLVGSSPTARWLYWRLLRRRKKWDATKPSSSTSTGGDLILLWMYIRYNLPLIKWILCGPNWAENTIRELNNWLAKTYWLHSLRLKSKAVSLSSSTRRVS